MKSSFDRRCALVAEIPKPCLHAQVESHCHTSSLTLKLLLVWLLKLSPSNRRKSMGGRRASTINPRRGSLHFQRHLVCSVCPEVEMNLCLCTVIGFVNCCVRENYPSGGARRATPKLRMVGNCRHWWGHLCLSGAPQTLEGKFLCFFIFHPTK